MSGLTSPHAFIHTSGMNSWKRNNPERVAEYGRRYRAAHKEQQREIAQRWRLANPERIKASKLAWKSRCKEWLQSKKTHCIKCGATENLDFHHRNPADKIDTVSKILAAYGPLKAQKEADKCDVLCKPCHKEQHVKRPRRTVTCPGCGHTF